jgi:hypothetical protein
MDENENMDNTSPFLPHKFKKVAQWMKKLGHLVELCHSFNSG